MAFIPFKALCRRRKKDQNTFSLNGFANYEKTIKRRIIARAHRTSRNVCQKLYCFTLCFIWVITAKNAALFAQRSPVAIHFYDAVVARLPEVTFTRAFNYETYPSFCSLYLQASCTSSAAISQNSTRDYSSVHTQQPAGPIREYKIDPYILLEDELKYVFEDIRQVGHRRWFY